MSEELKIVLVDSNNGAEAPEVPKPVEPADIKPQSTPNVDQPKTPSEKKGASSEELPEMGRIEKGLRDVFGKVFTFLEDRLNRSVVGRTVVNATKEFAQSDFGQNAKGFIDGFLSQLPKPAKAAIPTAEVVEAVNTASSANSLVSALPKAVMPGVPGGRLPVMAPAAAATATTAAAATGATGAVTGTGTAVAAGGVATAGAGAAAALSSIVPPIAAAVIVIGGLTLAVTGLLSLYKRQADELEAYNGTIAGVRAQFEARRVAQFVDRGEQIAPQVAAVEEAKNKLDEALFDVVTEIYKVVAKAAPLIETGVDGVTVFVRANEVVINILQALYELTKFNGAGAKQEMKEAATAQQKMNEAISELFNLNQNGPEEWMWQQDPFAPLQRQPNRNPNLANGRPNP
jgi:hypothetical protein